jgi:hypothetical protein
MQTGSLGKLVPSVTGTLKTRDQLTKWMAGVPVNPEDQLTYRLSAYVRRTTNIIFPGYDTY